jgi:tetratricopeptide (TPR) repeat protein
MLVQEFIHCLATNSATADQLQELQKSAKDYPFAGVLQQLAYNAIPESNADAVKLASLYKTNPFLFVYQKKKFSIGNTLQTVTTETKEVPKEWPGVNHDAIMKSDLIEIVHTTSANSDISAAIENDDLLITPLHAADYFTAQGIKATEKEVEAYVSVEKERVEKIADSEPADEKAQLLITRSFQDWLDYFKDKREKEQKENEDKQALRAMWQKEKLSVASEEENDLVPENVFKMAIDSLQPSEGSISEALANILVKQGKYSRAIEMYRKLSLQNPKKSAYFAAKLKEVEKLN